MIERFVLWIAFELSKWTRLGFWIRRKYFETVSKILDIKIALNCWKIERIIRRAERAKGIK